MEQFAAKIFRVAKSLIPPVIRQKIHSKRISKKAEIIRRIYKKRTHTLFDISATQMRIVLLMSPEHGNLGDHAIAKAEMRFFRDYMPGIQVVEISYGHYLYDRSEIRKHITKKDVLVTNGGGYLGTLWFHNEEMVRDIIESFPNNKIIILPQTIYFEDGDDAKEQLATTKAIYSNHKRLIFCAREKLSYNLIKSNCLLANADNCYLTPDIVTYLCESKDTVFRSGLLLCFREDKECVLSDEQKAKIIAYAKISEETIYYTSTVLNMPVSISDRDFALESKFAEFRKVKLVITDRLHGMLFAAITGTPCIAINNKSGKVKGCYELIQHLNYIKVIDNPDEIMEQLAKLLRLVDCEYDNSNLLHYFDTLAGLIKEI
ncbi:MAG: polysaccharide pyruvyl transferase family protein [Geobacteraceae bacterium]|nr:polysaccharide pyruvyl transferase family protein [Geobacteraceae bacterium]